MDTLNEECKNTSKEYIQKYDKLLSLVDGYEKMGTNNSVPELYDLTGKINKIINKTLLSEDDFLQLKKEQNNIMEEYDKLEQIKDKPFSKEALHFTETDKSPNLQKAKIHSEQKLVCDGSINQYYKMPNICININTDKTGNKHNINLNKSLQKYVQEPKVVKQQPKVVKQQPKVVKQQPKVVKQQPKVVKQQPKVVKQQPKVVKQQPKVVKQQPKSKKKKYIKKVIQLKHKSKLCKLNNKINEHNLF